MGNRESSSGGFVGGRSDCGGVLSGGHTDELFAPEVLTLSGTNTFLHNEHISAGDGPGEWVPKRWLGQGLTTGSISASLPYSAAPAQEVTP